MLLKIYTYVLHETIDMMQLDNSPRILFSFSMKGMKILNTSYMQTLLGRAVNRSKKMLYMLTDKSVV